jgi:hypothetical protein
MTQVYIIDPTNHNLDRHRHVSQQHRHIIDRFLISSYILRHERWLTNATPFINYDTEHLHRHINVFSCVHVQRSVDGRGFGLYASEDINSGRFVVMLDGDLLLSASAVTERRLQLTQLVQHQSYFHFSKSASHPR